MMSWIVPLVGFFLVTMGQADIELVKLDYDGESLFGSVKVLNPLTAELITRKNGIFIRMFWADRGIGFEQIYSNQSGVVGLANPLGKDTGDFDIAGNNLGNAFFIRCLKTDQGNRGEGVILRLREIGFEAVVLPATQRLGNSVESIVRRFRLRMLPSGFLAWLPN